MEEYLLVLAHSFIFSQKSTGQKIYTMEESLFVPRVPRLPRGCIPGLLISLLVIGVMFGSLAFIDMNQSLHADGSCSGAMGFGFPKAFLCDYGAGGSPLENSGRIDEYDSPFVSPDGFCLDVLFYSSPLWVLGLIIARLFKLARRREPRPST